jgi:hypothetical protein
LDPNYRAESLIRAEGPKSTHLILTDRGEPRQAHLLHHDLHLVVDIDQDDRGDICRTLFGSFKLALVHQILRASIDGRLDLLPDPLGARQTDHRSEVGVLVLRIAEFVGAGDVDDLLYEFVIYRRVDVDPFDGAARLSRVVHGTL